MKKTKNKILIRMISLMLAVIMLIPANIGAIIASAMIVNGTGEGGGSSTSVATSGYSVPTAFAPSFRHLRMPASSRGSGKGCTEEASGVFA